MPPHMRPRFAAICLITCLVLLSTSVHADKRGDATEQVRFGLQVARHNLWREALERFKRATQIDPTYAAAWNNLAIAYENSGDFGNAREAYSQAVKLDPDNQYIRQNFDLFKEIDDRANRQRSR